MAGKKKSESTALVNWDEELAKAAEASAKLEQNTGGGNFFSLKSGVLSWQDQPLPDNQMAVIVLGHIFENAFYEGDYDPDNPRRPTCYAFSDYTLPPEQQETQLKPYQAVVDASNHQHGMCAGCPQNEFGTADKGRGKACKNVRRLSVISAGDFDRTGKFNFKDDPEHYQSTQAGILRLPVTSVKPWGGYVKQLAGVLKIPPHGVVTKVRVVPDPKSQFKVCFDPVMNVPHSLLSAIMKRRSEVLPTLAFAYQTNEAEPEVEAKNQPKTVAKKKPARRY